MIFKTAALKKFSRFIHERHSIQVKKSAGAPWPWTKDPILQSYRFCNVYRNLDKESALIQDNWLKPHKRDPDVWFAMVVARLVNWWPSLEAIGYPLPWEPDRFTSAMDQRKDAKLKVFTGAYMIHADAHAKGTKAQYLAEHVLTPMWDARVETRPRKGDTLEAFHTRLMGFRDMGSFMAAQVVADTKYAAGSPLSKASDFTSWAAEGPGSMRGLRVVQEIDPQIPWPRGEWKVVFNYLMFDMAPYLEDMPPITGQDLQNCLCEYFKYFRGSSRSKYRPPSSKGNF